MDTWTVHTTSPSWSGSSRPASSRRWWCWGCPRPCPAAVPAHPASAVCPPPWPGSVKTNRIIASIFLLSTPNLLHHGQHVPRWLEAAVLDLVYFLLISLQVIHAWALKVCNIQFVWMSTITFYVNVELNIVVTTQLFLTNLMKTPIFAVTIKGAESTYSFVCFLWAPRDPAHKLKIRFSQTNFGCQYNPDRKPDSNRFKQHLADCWLFDHVSVCVNMCLQKPDHYMVLCCGFWEIRRVDQMNCNVQCPLVQSTRYYLGTHRQSYKPTTDPPPRISLETYIVQWQIGSSLL